MIIIDGPFEKQNNQRSAFGPSLHATAAGPVDEGIQAWDFVAITAPNGDSWIAQVVSPNFNYAAIGDPLHPMILDDLQDRINPPAESYPLTAWDLVLKNNAMRRPPVGSQVVKMENV